VCGVLPGLPPSGDVVLNRVTVSLLTFNDHAHLFTYR
jgi:hypothetical protein